MNMNRPDMTEDVKYKDYTNESLQMDSNLATMEIGQHAGFMQGKQIVNTLLEFIHTGVR